MFWRCMYNFQPIGIKCWWRPCFAKKTASAIGSKLNNSGTSFIKLTIFGDMIQDQSESEDFGPVYKTVAWTDLHLFPLNHHMMKCRPQSNIFGEILETRQNGNWFIETGQKKVDQFPCWSLPTKPVADDSSKCPLPTRFPSLNKLDLSVK